MVELEGPAGMTASAEFAQYVMELLQPIGRLHARRMFGGVGIWQDSLHFAIIMGNRLFFRVDDDSRAKYESGGSEPFSYATEKGRVVVRSYFVVPAELFDDPEALRAWAREAARAARAEAKPTPGSKKRTVKATRKRRTR